MIPQGTRVRSLPGRLYHPWDKREDACSSRSAVFWGRRPNTTPSRSTSNTRISNWPGSVRNYFATPRPELAHVAHRRANHPREHDDQVDALGLVGQLLDKINAGQKPKPPDVAQPDAYRPAFEEIPGDNWKTM